MLIEDNDTSMLNAGENHPMAHQAFHYVKCFLLNYEKSARAIEAIASTAISGCRTAEVCLGTISRIRNGMPVGERYVFGLAWMLKEMEENEKRN